MSEQTVLQSEPQTEEEYRAAVHQILAEIRRLNRQMEVDRAERERVRAESEILKAQTRRILADMGQRISLEQQHDREMAAKDRENLLLRLENYVLRAERRLPPTTTGEAPTEATDS